VSEQGLVKNDNNCSWANLGGDSGRDVFGLFTGIFYSFFLVFDRLVPERRTIIKD